MCRQTIISQAVTATSSQRCFCGSVLSFHSCSIHLGNVIRGSWSGTRSALSGAEGDGQSLLECAEHSSPPREQGHLPVLLLEHVIKVLHLFLASEEVVMYPFLIPLVETTSDRMQVFEESEGGAVNPMVNREWCR